ncbi:MAG: DUF512 domain-containing protein [Actinomycetota bacterium]|nr:DUF512 domain-containing protein [Actinomycetota bacterium]
MSLARITAVTEGSPAATAGVREGDELVSIGGVAVRDVIEYRMLADEPAVDLVVDRAGIQVAVEVAKEAGEPLGIEVSSPVFDRVRTCDNHCSFCFIYQLPKGMRRSLYVKDDDYRLSFLYGNFTTLTRFTEADLERVVTERLSPLYVSIHTTDGRLRARMLRNRRGATSLRWLRALLDNGVTVHGQVVVCPGVNDGADLASTLTGIADEYPELASVGVVPLGISRYSTEEEMRAHTTADSERVLDVVEDHQVAFLGAFGRRLVFAADEYYLMAGRPLPDAAAYEGYPQHENGVGIARAFVDGFLGGDQPDPDARGGFFQSVDGAPPTGYRSVRWTPPPDVARTGDRRAVGVITGTYGARLLDPLLRTVAGTGARVVPVANNFFGGNIAVAGLLCGDDVATVLAGEPAGERYLLPDVCLTNGRFLDGMRPEDLPRPVEVVAADGRSLRRAVAGDARVRVTIASAGARVGPTPAPGGSPVPECSPVPGVAAATSAAT